MRIRKINPSLGFDTSVYPQKECRDFLKDAGYEFVVRYVNRTFGVKDKPDSIWPVSLSKQELDELISEKRIVSIVQFAPHKTMPSFDAGKSAGNAAWRNCKELDIPEGVTVWCDLEWEVGDLNPSDVLDYANAWSSEVSENGYSVGMYIGPNIACSGSQLYYDVQLANHYWKSASIVPWVEKRGFQMVQSNQKTVCGGKLIIDQDIAMYDNKGDRFFVVSK